MLNCDETIEELLSAEGLVSGEVRNHLEGCPRCQSLVEILSPLVATAEANSNSEVGSDFTAEAVSLPVYDFERTPSPMAMEAARDAADRLRLTSAAVRQFSNSTYSRVKYVLAFFSGIAVSLAGFAVLHSEPVQEIAPVSTACLWETTYHSHISEADFVRSCVACHLVAQR